MHVRRRCLPGAAQRLALLLSTSGTTVAFVMSISSLGLSYVHVYSYVSELQLLC